MTEAERIAVMALARAAQRTVQALKHLQRTPYREHGSAGAKWRAAAARLDQAETDYEEADKAVRELCHEAYLASRGQGGEARAHG